MTPAILDRGTPVTEEEFNERSVTLPGEVLHLDEPLIADLVPEDLLPPD